MSKLSLDALKERAEATASTELLATISGGLENACHDAEPAPAPAAPTVPSSSHQIQININYGPNGWGGSAGWIWKF